MKKRLFILSLILFIIHNCVWGKQAQINHMQHLSDSIENDSDLIKNKLSHSLELEIGGVYFVYGLNYRLKYNLTNNYLVLTNGASFIPILDKSYNEFIYIFNQNIKFGFKISSMINFEFGIGNSLIYRTKGESSKLEDRVQFYEYSGGIYTAPYITKLNYSIYPTMGLNYRVKKVEVGLNFQAMFGYLYTNKKFWFPYGSITLNYYL